MTDGKAQRPEGSAQREARSEHIPTPEGQGGGEDKSGLAAALQRALHEMKTAKEKGYSLREFDEEDAEVIVAAARAHLLSSPRVEEVRRMREALETIRSAYEDHNLNHRDFRVLAGTAAIEAVNGEENG